VSKHDTPSRFVAALCAIGALALVFAWFYAMTLTLWVGAGSLAVVVLLGVYVGVREGRP
jgi:hypothetical protein